MKSPEHVSISDIASAMMSSGADPSELGLTNLDESVQEFVKKAIGGIDTHLKDVKLSTLATVMDQDETSSAA